MKSRSILLADLEPPYRDHLRSWASLQGVHAIATGTEIPAECGGRSFSLCVVSACGKDAEADERIRTLRRLFPSSPVVVLADGLSVEMVVRLMRVGVVDVIPIPAPVEEVARDAFAHMPAKPGSDIPEVVGGSAPMLELQSQIHTVAPMSSTVLLSGETGTGKGLVARVIHRLSSRAKEPFVHVDCAALSPTVIESELFGHERGAFTGALNRRPGRFELAAEGTIFLDEIGDLDLGLQAKLLRVLQDREFERIGGISTLRMEARVLAATSRDLPRAVAATRFRADLFFRLAVVHLRIPALRERPTDIPLLARSALQQIAARLGVPMPEVSDTLLTHLMCHTWPGNVRELMNVLERMLVAVGRGELSSEAFDGLFESAVPIQGMPDSPSTVAASVGPPPDRPGTEPTRGEIATALISTGGNVSRTARRLGIPRSTLRYRIQAFGLGSLIPED